MKSDLKVKIFTDKSSEEEYIIKDSNDIIIGRFNMIELNNSTKRCDIKLNFYRKNSYELLIETLNMIVKAAFNNNNTFKVNIRVLENIDIRAFLDIGFTLEGVLNQNEYYKGEYLAEFSFGITRIEYLKHKSATAIELIGENITLRNLTPGNAEELLNYYIKNKNYLAPFEPARDNNFYSLEVQRNLLNESYKQLINGTNIELGIFKGNRLIGKIKLSNIVYGSLKSGILGYSIDEDEQGKGYMKESVCLFLEYAFDECELHRVEASVLLNNEKSKAVLKSIGFKETGINEKYLMVNGKWQDHVTYYMIKDDFCKINHYVFK